MEVELHHFLRPELHFPSLEEMVEQMKKDSADAKRLLAG